MKKRQKRTAEEIARLGLTYEIMYSTMRQAAREMRRFNLAYVQMHERVDLGLDKSGKRLTVRRNGSDVKEVLAKNKPC